MWLDIYSVKHVLKFLNLIYVLNKSEINSSNYCNIVGYILVSMDV